MPRTTPPRLKPTPPVLPQGEDPRAVANRKLIRPQLSGRPPADRARQDRRRPPPPAETGLEAAHYQKQLNTGTRLLFTLEDGEVVHGKLEWFDRDSLMVRRDDGSEMLLMKRCIVHSCRAAEAEAPTRAASAPQRRPKARR